MAEIRSLYEEIKELGVVSSQREFSLMWGKGESWCSSSMTRKRKPGLDALVRFHVYLTEMERDSLEAGRSAGDQELAQSYFAGAKEVADINARIWSEIVSVARGEMVA